MFAWHSRPLRICSSLENPLIPLRAPGGFCFPSQMPACPGEPIPGFGGRATRSGAAGYRGGGVRASPCCKSCVFMVGGRYGGRSHPTCPGNTSPVSVAHGGNGPQGIRCLEMQGAQPRCTPRGSGGAGASRGGAFGNRSPSTASPCSVQCPERCRWVQTAALSRGGALRRAQRWRPSSGSVP